MLGITDTPYPCTVSFSFTDVDLKGLTGMGDSFRDLVVWQRGIELSVVIYRLTSRFPSDEKFGLTNQLRRASVSVPSNIAEGYGRATKGEYIQFLGHARGSVCEIETQLVIADALSYGLPESRRESETLCADVGRMLNAMLRKLRK